jgi:hypothetical protein
LRPLGRLESAAEAGVGRTSFSVIWSDGSGPDALGGEALIGACRSVSVRPGECSSVASVGERLMSREAGEVDMSCIDGEEES